MTSLSSGVRPGRSRGRGEPARARYTREEVVTAAIFQFVWTWTDFLNPLVYLNDAQNYTLSIGLYAFFGQNDVAWGPLMAACVLFTLPALLIFLIGQKFFIGGVSAGALK